MPILCFRNKINLKGYEEVISFGFNCVYDSEYHLKLKNCENDYFDSGDFRIRIEDAIEKLNYDLLTDYDNKNGNIRYAGLFALFL